ncbi:MAG TPA: hypothetical protein DER01_01370, partial [Phycisphaerales bacterium]|nr:hypothetical protein [Phycisphaerales bacterium]
ALYDNLDKDTALALQIDKAIRDAKLDNWRDNGGPKEKGVKQVLYEILGDVDEVERIFTIVKAQKEY